MLVQSNTYSRVFRRNSLLSSIRWRFIWSEQYSTTTRSSLFVSWALTTQSKQTWAVLWSSPLLPRELGSSRIPPGKKRREFFALGFAARMGSEETAKEQEIKREAEVIPFLVPSVVSFQYNPLRWWWCFGLRMLTKSEGAQTAAMVRGRRWWCRQDAGERRYARRLRKKTGLFPSLYFSENIFLHCHPAAHDVPSLHVSTLQIMII